MKDSSVYLIIFFVAIGVLFATIVVAEHNASQRCENLATQAGITTSYFEASCYLLICDTWIDQSDLPYHLKQVRECDE